MKYVVMGVMLAVLVFLVGGLFFSVQLGEGVYR